METYKEYRFSENPNEKIFHDKFKEMFERDSMAKKTLSGIVFGWDNNSQSIPNEYLTVREENICLTLIQWLGSNVGQGFLEDCIKTTSSQPEH